MSAGCAEMRKPHKIEGFIHFGETGDEPNSFDFYFQHNKETAVQLLCPGHYCKQGQITGYFLQKFSHEARHKGKYLRASESPCEKYNLSMFAVVHSQT